MSASHKQPSSEPRRPTIPPTITEETGPLEGLRKTHPAYGMLSFSRVNGGPGKLFGSEIHHNSYIQMELKPAEEVRSLSNTWYFGRSKCLCSVRLSCAQFAELITSMNVGSGVPVTIDYIPDEEGERPFIKDEDTLHQQTMTEVKKETTDAFADAKALCTRLTEMVQGSKLSKANQAELIGMVNKVTSAVEGSLPFVLDQYQEAAEKVAAKAKAELEAWTTAVIHNLGMERLRELDTQARLSEARTVEADAQDRGPCS